VLLSDRPYLDYYLANRIIPVRQDIGNLEKHFRRREALYRHLNIFPSTIRGKKVIEFGPGTGDNAVYTAAFRPDLYVFVDANPLSIEHIKTKADSGMLPAASIEYFECDIVSFNTKSEFDFVLCEGIVHTQREPKAFLQHMARVAGPDGIVVATTHSALSLFPEYCRRIFYPIFASEAQDHATLLKRIVSFFQKDLEYLPGMSRLPEDWAQDNIMQPWPDANRVVFTIEDAIVALDDDFDLLGTSPQFIQDWRWYKAIATDPTSINQHAISEARKWSIALLDHRELPSANMQVDGDLELECRAAINRCNVAWRSRRHDDIRSFLEIVDSIAGRLSAFAPRTSNSLRDFSDGVKEMLSGNTSADFGDFRSLFGRAQQYVSFIRKNRTRMAR
jgi:ubiquinone/menaquinone biosynthesis C-methylase UbiE